MAKLVEVRDTEDKGIGTEGKATGKGIDLPEKIRFPVDRSWWAWARAQDPIREIGAYNPTHNDKVRRDRDGQDRHRDGDQ